MNSIPFPSRPNARWVVSAQLGALLVLGLAANLWVELSVLAILLVLVLSLSLTPKTTGSRRLALAVAIASGVASGVGLVRFTLTKAMSGIAEGGQRAASKSALWRLREVLLAQDGMRKGALVDSDQDGIGEAELIEVLAGSKPSRTGNALTPPLLNYRFRESVQTAMGPAIRVASHLFIVCLPTRDGWTARDEGNVDSEAAERRFVAYAWPADDAPDVTDAWFIDEHENILELSQGARFYRGQGRPPDCDAALGSNAQKWRRWKEKRPRTRLPGDPAG